VAVVVQTPFLAQRDSYQAGHSRQGKTKLFLHITSDHAYSAFTSIKG
jgi:hypothetical protein